MFYCIYDKKQFSILVIISVSYKELYLQYNDYSIVTLTIVWLVQSHCKVALKNISSWPLRNHTAWGRRKLTFNPPPPDTEEVMACFSISSCFFLFFSTASGFLTPLYAVCKRVRYHPFASGSFIYTIKYSINVSSCKHACVVFKMHFNKWPQPLQ